MLISLRDDLWKSVFEMNQPSLTSGKLYPILFLLQDYCILLLYSYYIFHFYVLRTLKEIVILQ